MHWIKNLKLYLKLKLIRFNYINDEGAVKVNDSISKLVNLIILNLDFK
jgi:hypothetical protein